MTYGTDDPMRYAPPLALEAMVQACPPEGRFFPLWEGEVAPAWVDYNRHMNEAYYVLINSFATDRLVTATGQIAPGEGLAPGEGFSEAQPAKTVFTAESHIHYLAQCKQHQTLKAYFRLLGFDQKRHHQEILICHASHSDEGTGKREPDPADSMAERLTERLTGNESPLETPACIIEQMLLCYDQQAERVGTWSDEAKSWLLKIFKAQQSLALTPSFAYLFRVRGPEAHSVLRAPETSPRSPEA